MVRTRGSQVEKMNRKCSRAGSKLRKRHSSKAGKKLYKCKLNKSKRMNTRKDYKAMASGMNKM